MGYFRHFIRKMWRKYGTYYIRGLISSLIVTFFFSLIPLLNPMSYATTQEVVNPNEYLVCEQASNQAHLVLMSTRAYVSNKTWFDTNLRPIWEQIATSGVYAKNFTSNSNNYGYIDFYIGLNDVSAIQSYNKTIDNITYNLTCNQIKFVMAKRLTVRGSSTNNIIENLNANAYQTIPSALSDGGYNLYVAPVVSDFYQFINQPTSSGGGGSSTDYTNILNIMNTALNTIQGATTNIESDVADISSALDDVNSTLNSINTNIANSNYSQDLANLQSSLNTLNTSINSLVSTSSTQNIELNNSVNNVSNSVNDLSTTTQNGLNNVNNSVNNVSNSVNDLNNTISDNNVNNNDIDSSIGGLVDNSTDITEDGFATIFSSFIDSFSSGDSSVDVTIPFTNKSITISKNTVYGSFFTNNILGDLISAFYYFLVSWFIVIDIKRIFDKIKKGDIENSVSSDIREDLL